MRWRGLTGSDRSVRPLPALRCLVPDWVGSTAAHPRSTRFLALPPELLPAVRRATERYRDRKARLLEQADQGLAGLVAALAPGKSGR